MKKGLRNKIFLESWNIAIRNKAKGTLLIDQEEAFIVLNNNFSSWMADPFVFEYKGICYLFGEMYDYKSNRGTIGYTIYNPDTHTISKWKKIIEEPWHMSFPFIFERDGNIYIMPETNAKKILCEYKAIEFPEKWERTILLKGKKFVDTSLFPKIKEASHLPYAYTAEVCDSGEWKGCFLYKDENSIIQNKQYYSEDQRICRLAGAFFEYDGKFFRVAQNDKETYGKEIIFFKIDIKEEGYCEQEVLSIGIDDINFSKSIYREGIHTYNSSKHFEVIDIKTRRFSLCQTYWRIYRKVKRKLNR